MNQYLYQMETSEIPKVSTRLEFLRRYALFMAASNLAWETAHLPLYTLWTEGKTGDLVFAVFHCTGGDLMIAFATLGSAIVLVGNSRWPSSRFVPVMSLTVGLGLGYTLFSEWLNVSIRQSWAYST